MEIISFTGKSGTGKSYQATRICMERNIEAIIDDGLFIYKGKVVAGSSAKRSPTKAGALKTALFYYDNHKKSVKSAIKKYKPARLMIIGTSDKMVDWIIDALGLHEPDERLYIEDFTTTEEREIAYHSRHDDGKHVIPAPMGQLKMDFAGYFMNPLNYFKDFVLESLPKEYISTRDITVVRPQYSYSGKFTISAHAIRDIVSIAADEFDVNLVVEKIAQRGRENRIIIDVNARVLRDKNMLDVCKRFQERVITAIEEITSFTVAAVNVRITALCFDYTDLHKK